MNGLAKQFLWSMFLILLAQSYLFAVATNKTYNGSDFSDGGNNLTNTDFVISGVAQNDTVFNMELDASPEIYGKTAFSSGSAMTGSITVTVDGTNTGSFELRGISLYDYNAGTSNVSVNWFSNINIVGNLLNGGTVTSTNSDLAITTSGSNNGLDESDFDLSSFSGQQISSFEIQFNMLNTSNYIAPDNLTLVGFTITNAQSPAPADTTPPTLSSITHENIAQTTADLKATSDEDATMYYVVSTSSSTPTADQVINNTVTGSVKNGSSAVTENTAKTFNVTGLTAGTTYYYYMVAKDASENKSVVSGGDFVTISAINADATLTAGATVSEPVHLVSTAHTSGEAVNLFDFTITDGGGGDGLSTDVSQVLLHTAGTADFSKVTWRLREDGASNVVGIYSAGDNTLTFSGLSISVPDNSNKSYIVSGYYNSPTGLTNNQTYLLSIDGDNDLTVSASGTQMSGSNSAVSNGAGTQVDITATKLIFETLPSNSN